MTTEPDPLITTAIEDQDWTEAATRLLLTLAPTTCEDDIALVAQSLRLAFAVGKTRGGAEMAEAITGDQP